MNNRSELTEREKSIWEMRTEGIRYKVIASKFDISIVRVRQIYEKSCRKIENKQKGLI